MSSNSGIFGLSGFNDKNLEGLIPDKTRETYREYGYFGGGINPAIPGATLSISIVDRIDYSNDTNTASVRGPLSLARYYLSATGNSNFGYFSGGFSVSDTSTVDRIDYSNDNATASPRGPLSLARFSLAATGNSTFGYFGGGRNPSPSSNYSTVDRIDYFNDLSTTLVRGPLSLARYILAATGNSNFGYFGGGYVGGGGGRSIVERMSYSNDSILPSVRGSLSIARNNLTATGNNNFGYFGGASPGNSSTIDRINYSNDTAAASARTTLTLGRGEISATGNSNFGYFGGGRSLSPTVVVSTIERLDYSNDTLITSVRGPLSLARFSHAASSSHNFGGSPISQYGAFAKPFGYFGGGFGPISTIDRIDYSNDTGTATVRNTLLSIRSSFAFFGNSSFAYAVGGIPLSTTIERLEYSNDNSSLITRGPLSSARYQNRGTGNNNFGYSMGGRFPTSGPYLSSVDRINYINDTSITLSRGVLSSAKGYGAATGTLNFGYFGGGIPGPFSTVDRIDYTNDTTTASARSILSSSKSSLAATGNSNFGYFGGGYIPGTPGSSSTVDLIDYSNDTASASVRGTLSLGRSYISATGNNNFGYYGGGGFGPFPQTKVSTVDRIDYANDTATASVRGPLSSAKYVVSATSPTAFGGATDFTPTSTFFDIQSMKRIEDTTNESVKKRVLGSYGYFGGGFPGPVSTVDRIDYSNDTTTATARGPMSVIRRYLGATGNSNFGYYGGGEIDSLNRLSTVDRIDYSNDSSNTSVRSSLAAASYRTGFGNQFYGYFANSQGYTEVSRVDFSNDTNVLGKTIMYRKAYYRSSTGNNDYGYINEGLDTSVLPSTISSLIERVQYSNDNQRSLIRGSLNVARRNVGATGNSNFGYFAGGLSPSVPASYSSIERVNYSNDTTTASTRGVLSIARDGMGATGNNNFGYFGGGGAKSLINRLDYANDTETAQGRSALSSIRTLLTATTNARNS